MANSMVYASSIAGVIEDVPIHKIGYPANCLRSNLAGLTELAASIRRNGLLQPIVVRLVNDHFEVVAGNRRLKACELLKWRKITCHVVEMDDRTAFEFSLIENIQRETLSAVEEARAFKKYVTDFGWGGVSELAKRIDKSPSYVTKRMNLLNLPDGIVRFVDEMSLSASVAEELFPVKDSSKQSELAALIMKRHLSLRNTRELVDQYKAGRSVNSPDCVPDIEQKKRVFDKLIVILRVALKNTGELVNDHEDEWMLHEILMQHKSMLHRQIDLLIKERRKFNNRLLAS
ncbi:MAG: ParB/RepB/Spo0J family partition protein [Thaumarchaeota archaeon]|nr:ParB/RepB/Spo0J family partition protein [Nitrososphaerota archaeon]MCL5317198.1 ParB/RepB/Spo0J family partition protein [Nitrososphaerota archaeon]